MSDDAKRICSNCEYALHGPGGVYCRQFSDDIADETVAVDCVAWDPLPSYRPPAQENGHRPEVANAAIREALRLPPKAEVVDALVAKTPAAELVATCEEYLRLRHCTLFGQVFEIISPRGRAEAAEWLATQITAINNLDRVAR